tara:strand:+ start:696 stop:1262 length:567 start_codon:yes stop_codon:yes gene_type:complete
MILLNALKSWCERVLAKGGSEVWVDEGGLCLCTDNDAHNEVGGEPDEDDACIAFGGDDGGQAMTSKPTERDNGHGCIWIVFGDWDFQGGFSEIFHSEQDAYDRVGELLSENSGEDITFDGSWDGTPAGDAYESGKWKCLECQCHELKSPEELTQPCDRQPDPIVEAVGDLPAEAHVRVRLDGSMELAD